MGVNAKYVLHYFDNDIRKKMNSKCVCLARGSCEIPANQEHVIKKGQENLSIPGLVGIPELNSHIYAFLFAKWKVF